MNNYKLAVIIKIHFVNVLSTKVLIEDTIFMSPTGDKGLEGLAVCRVKGSTFICQLFQTSSNGLALTTEPMTSHSAIKCSTD